MSARARPRMLRSPSRVRGVLVMVRDVASAASFLGPEGVGLPVAAATPTAAVLGDAAGGGAYVGLQLAEREAELSKGYSPFVCVDVDDLDMMVPRLIMKGAALDGAIKHEIDGKFAVLREPDGLEVAQREPPAAPALGSGSRGGSGG